MIGVSFADKYTKISPFLSQIVGDATIGTINTVQTNARCVIISLLFLLGPNLETEP